MTENNIPTSEILNRAADLIQERGWATGGDAWADRNESGPLCLEGGIQVAAGIEANFEVRDCPAAQAVVDYLGAEACTIEFGQYKSKPWAYLWNDKPGRTATEVIEVLRSAAAIEQARESDVAPLATTQREVSA